MEARRARATGSSSATRPPTGRSPTRTGRSASAVRQTMRTALIRLGERLRRLPRGRAQRDRQAARAAPPPTPRRSGSPTCTTTSAPTSSSAAARTAASPGTATASTDALVDCPDHYPNGSGAILENLFYGDPTRTHDPVGWPTFADWPAYDSLTHEQTYYRWLERAWLGGERLMVNNLVENGVLCRVYPLQAELLRRDGRRPPAGAADVRAAGLHRRPGGRPRRGLLPDRHQPLPGAPGDQRRQARDRPRDRGVGAVRLHRVPRRSRSARSTTSRPGSRRSRSSASARSIRSTSSTTPSAAPASTAARSAP